MTEKADAADGAADDCRASDSDATPVDHPDDIRFLLNAYRRLREDAALRLWERGWAAANVDASDHQELERFWPPTAPVGYGRGSAPAGRGRDGAELDEDNPWLRPTRIVGHDSAWEVEFGEATAQKPEASVNYSDSEALLVDLERIECWPMSVKETHSIRMARLFATTMAAAQNLHSPALDWTEPYLSRARQLQQELRRENERPPGAGDVWARLTMLDAEAWASAIRTARAGGEDV